ncbi:DUF6387 family protein [Burkholderia pseudomallei]|uniref:DUF6387 family protein n=1 Tax=Burkholderia pseudomallei TaxID=28450 RepID=UPI000B18BD4B|nr:DUF6387 family protein [Burkholderia pseudomallei]
MEIIKSSKDLPTWFRDRTYEKNLSAVEWYCEIVSRVFRLESLLELLEEQQPDAALAEKIWDTRSLLTDWRKIPKDSGLWKYFYVGIDQNNKPVDDLNYLEVYYLSEGMTDYPQFLQAKRLMSELLSSFQKLHGNREDVWVVPPEYKAQLENFILRAGGARTEPAHQIDAGNPFLDYGRPLNGFPITVDTQYDDATLEACFKKWLKERRRKDGERARRPFNQNDFDDWQQYRIREVFDLDLWSRLTGTRITDQAIVSALWPAGDTDNFNALDHLRTTVRANIKKIFVWPLVVRFYGQLRMQVGENFLIQENFHEKSVGG